MTQEKNIYHYAGVVPSFLAEQFMMAASACSLGGDFLDVKAEDAKSAFARHALSAAAFIPRIASVVLSVPGIGCGACCLALGYLADKKAQAPRP